MAFQQHSSNISLLESTTQAFCDSAMNQVDLEFGFINDNVPKRSVQKSRLYFPKTSTASLSDCRAPMFKSVTGVWFDSAEITHVHHHCPETSL